MTVIIPVFNGGLCVGRAIDSALAQTHAPLQVVVVNDGSTDDTEGVIERYGGRVEYLLQANAGETAARNRGLTAARGEYVAFLDHDDYWRPGFAAACVGFLDANPHTVAVSVAAEHRSALSDTPIVKPGEVTRCAGGPRVIDDFFRFWAAEDHLCVGAVMLRTSVVRRAGWQRVDLVLSGDVEYWAYLGTFGPWGFIPEVLLTADGRQVAPGRLYDKYFERFRRVGSFDDWDARVRPRLGAAERSTFDLIRGRVATGYVLAHSFVGRDRIAYELARKERTHLSGRFGRLWGVVCRLGYIPWRLSAACLRARWRVQYGLRDRRRSSLARGRTRG